jgi:hypothetical protein
MPRGPNGEKPPADVIGNAVHVMRIATGEIEDVPSKGQKRAKGGKARAKALSPTERSEIARTAASARWKKGDWGVPSSSSGALLRNSISNVRFIGSWIDFGRVLGVPVILVMRDHQRRIAAFKPMTFGPLQQQSKRTRL